MTARLPTRLEVAAMVRLAESEGGFAAVLARGDGDSGTLLLVTRDRGADPRVWERPPGRRAFAPVASPVNGPVKGPVTGPVTVPVTGPAAAESPGADAVSAYLERRRRTDPDLWILELDTANPERLVARLGD